MQGLRGEYGSQPRTVHGNLSVSVLEWTLAYRSCVLAHQGDFSSAVRTSSRQECLVSLRVPLHRNAHPSGKSPVVFVLTTLAVAVNGYLSAGNRKSNPRRSSSQTTHSTTHICIFRPPTNSSRKSSCTGTRPRSLKKIRK